MGISSASEGSSRVSLFYHSSVELTKQALATPIRPENVVSASTVVESSLALFSDNLNVLSADGIFAHHRETSDDFPCKTAFTLLT